jgi:PAS domain S-box-containing protein
MSVVFESNDKNNFFEEIIHNLPNMVFIKEARELRFVLLNPAGEKMLGLKSEELLGKNDYDFFSPEQAEFFQSKDRDVIERGRLQVIEEEPINTREGVRWLKTMKLPLFSNDGEPQYLLGISEDITELKLKKDQLIENEKFLQETIDKMPAIFYAKDTAGRFLMINEPFRQLFNMTSLEIVGKTNHQLFPKDIADQFRINDLEIINSKQVKDSEEIAQNAKGATRVYHSIKYPYFDQDNNVVATGGISIDITDKKEFERQANHNAKLASIGELAAGIGHEVNNPLAIIQGHVMKIRQKMNMGINAPGETISDLDKIDSAIDRIGNIVQGLRSFSRADRESSEDFDLIILLRESINMLFEIYLQEGITISQDYEAITGIVHGNRGRIQQVLVNLIANAKDATKGKNDRQINVKCWVKGSSIMVSIADNGEGIPESIIDKIFDPFFTTKEVNKGTGIGLSLVHNIMQEHKGSVSVDSQESEGSRFVISLPLSSFS